MIRVDIYAYERGRGNEIIDFKYFKEIAEAKKYLEKFNSKNILPDVPDYYEIARIS